MTALKYPRGSEWRKWDLHFHTPASDCYEHKGATNEQIVDTMIRANVGVFSVTDHHFMDVQRIKELQHLAGERITIFPGIELRTELGGSSSVHMIGIFPEDCNIEYIWTKLSGGLGITPVEVERKGKDRVYVDFKESANLIKALGGIVTVHAGNKSNAIEEIRNSKLYKQQLKTDLLRDSVDILEASRSSDADNYIKIVFPKIGVRRPICVFSDNHDIREYLVSEPCWIKADPTFHGLRQVINEPEDRVFIGKEPPSLTRASQHPTRIANRIGIKKTIGAKTSETWFNASIPLSSELVAVIGKKGSGKSALSDILGLLGNTQQHSSFSFLTPSKFRNPKSNKSKQFMALLRWADGTHDTVSNLSENPEKEAVEKIKYIPQSHLEKVCNGIENGKDNQFHHELMKIIFSHVPEAEKLGRGTLDELLEYRSEETYRAIAQHIAGLQRCNNSIVDHEMRSLPGHRSVIDGKLKEKKREHAAHLARKPTAVVNPDSDLAARTESQAIVARIERESGILKMYEAGIANIRASEQVLARKRTSADNLNNGLANLKRIVDAFLDEEKQTFEYLGIPIDSVVELRIDSSPIASAIKAIYDEQMENYRKLQPDTKDGPQFKYTELNKGIEEQRKKLNEPQRAYQEYLKALDKWSAEEAKISGNNDAVGSIAYFKKQLADLEKLPAALAELRVKRETILVDIYREKKKLQSFHEKYYEEAQKFLNNHQLATKEPFKVTFNVSMTESGFSDKFLEFIHQGRAGPFMGGGRGK